MQITWLGYNAFRFTSNGVTMLTNPIERDINFAIHRQGADIVVSPEREDAESVVSGAPFLISTPGEYEVKSVFIHGIPCNGSTLYLFTIEDIGVAFIGTNKLKELTSDQLSFIEGADVLIVPVGGGTVCTAKEAAAIINQVEPRVVIPSYHKITGSKGLESVDVFLKEYSAPHETVDKIKFSKKDVINEDTKVIVLNKL